MAVLVTIGITCYNAEDTILRAIVSATKQDWAEKEIIIVDDNSTDGSVKKIKQLIADHQSIKLIESKRNDGAAKSRNKIIKQAKGEYIIFFDDDDQSLPNRVKTQLNKIETSNAEQDVFCYASGKRIYPNGYSMELRAIGADGKNIPGLQVVNFLLLGEKSKKYFFGTGTPACSLMCKTQLLRKLNGFNPKLRRVEDIELAIRAGLENVTFLGTSESLFIQYASTGNDKSALKNYRSEMLVVKLFANYLNSLNRLHFTSRWTKLRYLHFSRDHINFACSFLLLLLRFPILTIKKAWVSFPRRWAHERKIK